NDVAFAPDGKTIATAGADGIRLWDAETGAAIRQFAGRAYNVFFSPDGRHISDGTHFWDLASGEPIVELKTAKAVSFSPDGKLLPAVGEVGFGREIYTARLVEVVTDKEILTLVRDKNWISSAAFAPDGRTVATAERTA